MDKGSLPALAPGIEVYAGIRPSIWRLEVVGAYLAKEAGSLSAVAAASVVGEAMVALVLADAVLEKFGGDSVGELLRNGRGYEEQVRRY